MRVLAFVTLETYLHSNDWRADACNVSVCAVGQVVNTLFGSGVEMVMRDGVQVSLTAATSVDSTIHKALL